MSTRARSSPPPELQRGLPERYALLRHLATGGMATVWCAEDRVLGRQVAIKIMSERFAREEVARRRFQREARAAARVSAHPNVVTVFDVGELQGDEDRRPFIVMEHLAGGTVADALRCRAVTPDEARRWLREAAAALDHAHARGIVHRDIKPANFLLDRGRGLRVADFGIAHLTTEDTITSAGELFGTAGYLSPEQGLGRDASSASDRYALAVAAFELLTGGRPFTAPQFAAQARQHIEDPVPLASAREPSLPGAVDSVLVRGMAKDPDDRYPSAAAFVEALDAALTGGLGEAPEPTRPTRVLPVRRFPSHPPRPAPASTAQRRPGRQPSVAAAQIQPGTLPRRRGRALPLLALGVAVIGLALVLALGAGSSPRRTSLAQRATTKHPITRATTQHRTAPAAATTAATSSTAASATGSGSATSPSSPPALTASELQVQGHNQLTAGNYSDAITSLERAIDASTPGTLTYAYALYDLGHALLLNGNAKAAIPVLEQRLKIPNQTSTVQALLDQAMQAAGDTPAPSAPPKSGGAAVGPGHGHGRGHGPGGVGGQVVFGD